MKKIKVSKAIHETEESAEIVASIDDLLTQILLRLPIKSLLRFKIVSKHWHSHITNPRFIRRRNPDPNPSAGLFLSSPYIWASSLIDYVPFSPIYSTIQPFRKLDFTQEYSGVRILQSCNGLLLCCSFMMGVSSNTKYYVYNPTTNQCTTLPELARSSGMSLAFDSAKSPHYKVVSVGRVSVSGNYQYQIDIYSPEIGAWRASGGAFTSHKSFQDGVYWNGAVHWIRDLYENVDSLYFDIHNHMLEKMPNPPMSDDTCGRVDYYFGESCDHLHYIPVCGSKIQFDVYEMKRDYSEWFVKYRVDLSLVAAANPRMIGSNSDQSGWCNYAFSIVFIVRGEEEDDSFLVVQIPGHAIRYNLVLKTFEKLHDFEGAEVKDVKFKHKNGFQYIESLCSV